MSAKQSTGPTSILKQCPFCKEMVRVDPNGRLDDHKRTDGKKGLCKGSGRRPDPTGAP